MHTMKEALLRLEEAKRECDAATLALDDARRRRVAAVQAHNDAMVLIAQLKPLGKLATELLERLAIKPETLTYKYSARPDATSNAVDRLMYCGFCERFDAEGGDSRMNHYRITDAGRAKLAAIRAKKAR